MLSGFAPVHWDKIQWIAKLFSSLTFVVYSTINVFVIHTNGYIDTSIANNYCDWINQNPAQSCKN